MDQETGGDKQYEEQDAQQVGGDMQIAVALQQPSEFAWEGGQVGELQNKCKKEYIIAIQLNALIHRSIDRWMLIVWHRIRKVCWKLSARTFRRHTDIQHLGIYA